jgi:hypothetical protein
MAVDRDLSELRRATNLGEYLEVVSNVQRSHFLYREEDVWGPWFRGHQKAHWSLLPKLYRGGYDAFLPLRRTEDEIREEFILRAQSLSDPIPANAGKWEWYSLMQHHGAPTRLLDWTDGSLIGLYFAVKDNPGYYDAAVWMLDPYKLNMLVLHEDAVFAPGAGSARDRGKVDPWLPEHFDKSRRLPKPPIPVIPTHIARRISSQRSCFTIHGADKRGLEMFRTIAKRCLAKIFIPSTCVQAIRMELEACGIDEATIFPDLDGLSRCMSVRWRPHEHEPPHRGVYTRLCPSRVDEGGVGVFAIRPIPRGELIFWGDNEEIHWVDEASFKRQPKAIRELYRDFPTIKGPRYGCPLNFNRLTVAWYINEPRKGERPNVRCEAGQGEYDFYALRDIKAGEELTVVYDYSDSPPTDL